MGINSFGEQVYFSDTEGNESIIKDLRAKVLDLQFIVSHLRDDISCTLETGGKTFKAFVESEIGRLVFSILEEFVHEKEKLNTKCLNLEKENACLIENEGGLMDELASLSMEKGRLLQRVNLIPDNCNILSELNDLESVLFDNNWILNLKHVLKSMEEKYLQQRERLSKDVIEQSTLIESLKKTVRDLNDELLDKTQISSQLNEARDQIVQYVKKESEFTLLIDALNAKISDQESKMNEIMQINCELMDFTEKSKAERNILLAEKNEALKKDSEKCDEIENLKKIVTAQKIELERNREILARERKLSALKISDLSEQLQEKENMEISEPLVKL